MIYPSSEPVTPNDDHEGSREYLVPFSTCFFLFLFIFYETSCYVASDIMDSLRCSYGEVDMTLPFFFKQNNLLIHFRRTFAPSITLAAIKKSHSPKVGIAQVLLS